MAKRAFSIAMATTAMVSCALWGDASAADDAAPQRAAVTRSVGPDIICAHIYDAVNWGEENGIVAMSVGTRSCNVGSMEVSWRIGTSSAPDNRHPVIAQSLFRLENGRFEQIGQSWLKHGFCATDGDSYCTGCQDNGDCGLLGVGCSDPYSAVLNGTQADAGPKFQVNPVNGGFAFPPADPAWNGVVARRLQARQSDLPEASGGIGRHADARYFVGAHYIAADEALWGNDLNNMAYREVRMSEDGIAALLGDTVAELPPVFAWKDADPAVEIVSVDVPNDGRYYLAYRVTVVNRDVYMYEYALMNYNSDRAARAFSVPAADGVDVSAIGFHDVDYHSGEPFDNADWLHERGTASLRWFGRSFEDDVYANALRWGTLYNFRFVSTRPPRSAMVELELFKPHVVPVMAIAAVGPTPREDVTMDGVVGSADVIAVLQRWASDDAAADVNADGMVDVFDLLAVLKAWGG